MTRDDDLKELESAAEAVRELYFNQRTGEWYLDGDESEVAKRIYDAAMKVLRLI